MTFFKTLTLTYTHRHKGKFQITYASCKFSEDWLPLRGKLCCFGYLPQTATKQGLLKTKFSSIMVASHQSCRNVKLHSKPVTEKAQKRHSFPSSVYFWDWFAFLFAFRFRRWNFCSPPFPAFKTIWRTCTDARITVPKFHFCTTWRPFYVPFQTQCPHYGGCVSWGQPQLQCPHSSLVGFDSSSFLSFF